MKMVKDKLSTIRLFNKTLLMKSFKIKLSWSNTNSWIVTKNAAKLSFGCKLIQVVG